MKIYIDTDLEGITGIVSEEHMGPKGRAYSFGQKMWANDLNAAIEGAFLGGANEVFVCDGHDCMLNGCLPEMDPRPRYILGRQGGASHMPFVFDESIDLILLIGLHAMAGAKNAVWDHTMVYTGVQNFWVNDMPMGEIGLTAVIGGAYDIPVGMISSDRAGCDEARNLLGDQLPVACVKEATSRFGAVCLHPKKTFELIRDTARYAVENAARFKPFKVKEPMSVRLEVTTTDQADSLMRKKGMIRIDSRTLAVTLPSAKDVFYVW